MSLTAEQLTQIEYEVALSNARQEADAVRETRQIRFELIKIAKEVLIENARVKPADSRDVTANDITSFANTLGGFVNQ
jgi:hypothetical protein